MRYNNISLILVFLAVVLTTTLQADEPGSIVVWGQNNDGLYNVSAPNRDFVAIAAGGWHCLGLRADGSVTAWGNNMYGQCDVPIPNTGFVAISAGIGHNLGLKADGSVTAWGSNGTWQCNVPSPNTGFVAVSAGSYSLGVKADGSIVSWGDILFMGTSLEPNTGFVSAAAATFYDLGLKADGSIVVWGMCYYGESHVPAPNTGFVAISTSGSHCLGLKGDGSVVAWGSNYYGQCDVPAPNTGFVAIAAADYHSLGLKADGSIVAWGSNDRGQSDVPTPNTGFIAIAAGYQFSMGMKSGNIEIGSLQVMIEPQEAIDAGARWRRVGTTTWHYNGYIEMGIPIGECTFEFKDISELAKPANLSVTILAGPPEEISARYTPGLPNIQGRVTYEEGSQQGPVVGIPVYLYQEEVTKPIWQGTSDADGYYKAEAFNDNYNPDGPQRFYVEAKWEDEVIAIKDQWLLNFGTLIKEREPGDYTEGSKLPDSLDLIFDDSDAFEDYLDAHAVFTHVHDAYTFLGDNFHCKPSQKVDVLINKWYLPVVDKRDGDYATGLISFRSGKPSDWNGPEVVWHEYGHAIHDQKSSVYGEDWDNRFEEGWAVYFSHFAGVQMTCYEENHDYAYYRRGDAMNPTYAWAQVYADVFLDIEDPCNVEGDRDGIDGENTGSDLKGIEMVWKVIMEDEATDIIDFYNKFSARYPALQQALFEIYDSHGIWDFRTATTTNRITPTQTLTTIATSDSTASRGRFFLSWTGSDLDLTLTSPTGRVIDPVYAATDPNITYVEEQTQEHYIVERPEPGEWQMNVTAVEVPPEGEDYSTTAYVTTTLMLMLSSDKETYNINEPIMLTAELLYESNSYSDANVAVQIQTPEGIETVILFDDGLHNDANSSDGIYANTCTNTSVEGQYIITATASGKNPFGEPFARETSKTIVVQNLPDLIPLELTMNDELLQGQATLAALVLNDGSKDANDILVRFYDVNDTNTIQIGNDITIDLLESYETKEVSVTWDFTEGIHSLIVIVDPLDAVLEEDETNNYLGERFCMGWESQGDLNNDCIVNLLDLAGLTDKWLESCSEPDWCSGADIDKDGRVGFSDILIIADHWLSDM